ncbi:hypothetical protein QYF36_023810 [Acer negundo]|nr:hypothetical protein QYF36_023810 [Acer negundo]
MNVFSRPGSRGTERKAGSVSKQGEKPNLVKRKDNVDGHSPVKGKEIWARKPKLRSKPFLFGNTSLNLAKNKGFGGIDHSKETESSSSSDCAADRLAGFFRYEGENLNAGKNNESPLASVSDGTVVAEIVPSSGVRILSPPSPRKKGGRHPCLLPRMLSLKDEWFGCLKFVKTIYDIRTLLKDLHNIKIVHNSRDSNSMADSLAKKGSSNSGDFVIWGAL